MIQDAGRFGFQRYGVPICGPMDYYAFFSANLLVGNPSNAPCLEITVVGPELTFLQEAQVAITGAALSPAVNGEEAALWQTLQLSKGDVLSFSQRQAGCRAYLAIRGGIDVAPVLGSRSTCVRGKFGGYRGRPLKAEDIIETTERLSFTSFGRRMPESLIPNYDSTLKIDAVIGPQDDYFTDQGIETFFSSSYTVTSDSDRMGYRLDGPPVELKDAREMVSDAIPVGAIQIPRSGRPIIAMRDANTTGGYPKLGVITTPGCSLLGQAKPNDNVTFSRISPIKAREKVTEFLETLGQLKESLVDIDL